MYQSFRVPEWPSMLIVFYIVVYSVAWRKLLRGTTQICKYSFRFIATLISSCIQYVEKYVNLFHYYRCQVTLVFDGQPLPAKKDVTDSRNQKREDNRKLGTELLNNGHAEKALTIFKQGIGLPGKITRDTIRVRILLQFFSD